MALQKISHAGTKFRLEWKKEDNVYRQFLRIGMSVAAQSLLEFFVNLLGTIMLGRLGEVEVSAASLSNQMFLILSLLIYGVVGGSNVMVAQLWGKKDKSSIKKVLAYTYQVGTAAAIVLSFLSIFFPGQILSILTSDSRVIHQGIDYLRIVACSYLFYTFITITTGTLRALGNVRISMAVSGVALLVNGSLSYILIFGKLHMRPMGVTGAAVAILAARVAETILLLIYLGFMEQNLKLRLKDLLHLDSSVRKQYFSNTVPVMTNELLWSVGSSVLAVIIGRMSTEFVAANSMFSVTEQIAGVMGQGFTAAGAVMIGTTIGSGEIERVHLLKRKFQMIGLFSGIFTALMVLLLRPLILAIYHVNRTTLLYANQIMWIGAVIQIFKVAQSMNMMGILRAGGDATFVMINDIVFLWTLEVPLGFFAGLVWHWPVPMVYCILNLEQFIKLFTSGARLRSDKWMKQVTVSEALI